MSFFIPRFEVRLVREGRLKSELKYFGNSTDAYEVLRPLFEDLDREKMGVLFLDNKHKLIGFQFVAIGSIDEAPIFPREIIKPALLCNAAALILCHNHPSGSSEPSREDRRLTREMKSACTLFSIRLLDHLVIGDACFCSMADTGLI